MFGGAFDGVVILLGSIAPEKQRYILYHVVPYIKLKADKVRFRGRVRHFGEIQSQERLLYAARSLHNRAAVMMDSAGRAT